MPTLSVAGPQLAVAELAVIELNAGVPGALGGVTSEVVKLFELTALGLLAASLARTWKV